MRCGFSRVPCLSYSCTLLLVEHVCVAPAMSLVFLMQVLWSGCPTCTQRALALLQQQVVCLSSDTVMAANMS